MRGLILSESPSRTHALVLWVLLFLFAFRFCLPGINGSSPRPATLDNMIFSTAAQTKIAGTKELNSMNHTITTRSGKISLPGKILPTHPTQQLIN